MGNESTVGDYAAGRNPEKKVKTLLNIPSDSHHSQSFHKQRKPLLLHFDFECNDVHLNWTQTLGTANSTLSSNSRVTLKAQTQKHDNQQLASDNDQ